MIAVPSIAAAKQTLAESRQRVDAAQTRLRALDAEAADLDASKASAATVDAIRKNIDRRGSLRRERREVHIDRDLAIAMTIRDEQRLIEAETHVERAALDARCAEVAATIAREYPPAAAAIVALMATHWRLAATLRSAEKRTLSRVPRLRESLISPEFCGSLRLPNIGPDGLNGNLWYRGEPARLDQVEVADAVPLGDVRLEAFVSGKEEAELAARAAKTAAAAIVAAYEDRARKIVSLLEIETDVVAKIEQMKSRLVGLQPGLIALPTPTERLTGGRLRTLSGAVFLPAAAGRGEPLWLSAFAWRSREKRGKASQEVTL